MPVGKVTAIKLLLGNAEADISVPVYLELTKGVVVTGDDERANHRSHRRGVSGRPWSNWSKRGCARG